MSPTACSMSPRYAAAGCAATSRDPASGSPSMSRPNGLTPHHAWPRSSTSVRTSPMPAQRRGAEVDRRLATRTRPRPSSRRGTPRWSRRGRAHGCGRARGRARARGVSGGNSSTSISISSTSTGEQRLHPLDGHALGQLVGDLGELGVLLAELGRASSYVVGEQQLAARRCPEPLDPTLVPRWCAGRRRRSCGSRRSRRRRTPRAAGAPRSAGRRRRCRRGRRTRRASRRGRRGSTPHPRAVVRRPRARPPGPAPARPARGRPAPSPAAGARSGPARRRP